jgi:hypothetical protein
MDTTDDFGLGRGGVHGETVLRNHLMKRIAGLYIVWLVTAGLLVSAAVQRHPYSFYTLLRWICCPVLAYSAFAAHERNRVLWVWIFGVLAALYNPIFAVHLNRSTWIGVNWFTVGAIVIAGVVFRACHDASCAGSSDPTPRAPHEQPPSTTPNPAKRSRRFKITIWALVVVAILVGVAAFAIHSATQAAKIAANSREQAAKVAANSRELEASKHRISSSEIQLVGLHVEPLSQHDWDLCTLEGRVRNRSLRYTLTGVNLTITLRDKLPSGESDIIGKEDANINVTVPPGQARELWEPVGFAGCHKRMARSV